jgi:hypothetical protein
MPVESREVLIAPLERYGPATLPGEQVQGGIADMRTQV